MGINYFIWRPFVDPDGVHSCKPRISPAVWIICGGSFAGLPDLLFHCEKGNQQVTFCLGSRLECIQAYGTIGHKNVCAIIQTSSCCYLRSPIDYLKNIEVSLLAGRFFLAADGASNKNFIVINEKTLEAFHLGSPIEALGQQIIYQNDSSRKQIIGVVKNYNHEMLMEKIDPWR